MKRKNVGKWKELEDMIYGIALQRWCEEHGFRVPTKRQDQRIMKAVRDRVGRYRRNGKNPSELYRYLYHAL